MVILVPLYINVKIHSVQKKYVEKFLNRISNQWVKNGFSDTWSWGYLDIYLKKE